MHKDDLYELWFLYFAALQHRFIPYLNLVEPKVLSGHRDQRGPTNTFIAATRGIRELHLQTSWWIDSCKICHAMQNRRWCLLKR